MRSPSLLLPERGKLTDIIIATFTEQLTVGSDAPILVGDARKPADSGWPGEANSSDPSAVFAPYVTVGTGTARRKPGENDAIAQGHTTWLMYYTLRNYGGARSQADWTADQVRGVAIKFTGHTVDLGGFWTIRLAYFDALAPVVANDTDDPPTWTVEDTFILDITRSSR